MTETSLAPSNTAWGLGLAACLCNLLIVLLPFGILLGIAGFIIGLVQFARAKRMAGIVVSGVSFLIAVIIVGTVLSVFWVDPTLF